MDKNIFRSFFKEREIDLERNTSGFVLLQAFELLINFQSFRAEAPIFEHRFSKINPLATCKEICGSQRQ